MKKLFLITAVGLLSIPVMSQEKTGWGNERSYLVVSAGSFDLLAEVVVADDGELLDLTNRIRSVKGVQSTETFIYLDLVKQTFTWGAH